MVETSTENNLPRPSYSLKKSDWLKLTPPPIMLKTYWLKPRYQITLMVETPAPNNLPRPSYSLKKSDWLGQTNKQTLSIFNRSIFRSITLSFRKGNNNYLYTHQQLLEELEYTKKVLPKD
jgi:hypothetical protein